MLKRLKWPLLLVAISLLQLLSASASASEKSASVLFNSDKSKIFSANFDAGSVSIINRDNGNIINEQTIGRDIRRIAYAEKQQLLLASDFQNNKVILLDAKTLAVKTTFRRARSPFWRYFR